MAVLDQYRARPTGCRRFQSIRKTAIDLTHSAADDPDTSLEVSTLLDSPTLQPGLLQTFRTNRAMPILPSRLCSGELYQRAIPALAPTNASTDEVYLVTAQRRDHCRSALALLLLDD